MANYTQMTNKKLRKQMNIGNLRGGRKLRNINAGKKILCNIGLL